MASTRRRRLPLIPLVCLPAFAGLYWYLASRDWAHMARQYHMGDTPTWPRLKHGYHPPAAVHTALSVASPVAHVVVIAAAVASMVAIVAVARRALARHRRASATVRWDLRLGRDDLANPYRVQEAFEGIAGAIGVRSYERLWRGPEHLALEIHRLNDASVRFVIAAPSYLEASISGPLEDLYPDVQLIEVDGEPEWGRHIMRLKKRSSFVLSLQTTRNYEHAFTESLVALIAKSTGELSVQLVLTPASRFVHRRSRRLLKRRERALQHADRRDPGELGIDSVIEAKELKGALETQHRTLYQFDLRVCGDDRDSVKRVAGLFSQLRSENELLRREIRARRMRYAKRIAAAAPNPLPSLRTGVLSTSELATLWQLPRGRVKTGALVRAAVRRAGAPAGIERDSTRVLMRDEHGAVSLAPGDRKFGHALIGGQGGGKSSVLARHFANDAQDEDRAVILVDPKGPLAELCLGLAPTGRPVHYMDLGRPEVGINPLTIAATPGARAAVFLQALIEANPPGAIQAASDSFLRQAVAAVCTVEQAPTLWHVYRMLDFGDSPYRLSVVRRLTKVPGADFARRYWRREFPALITDRGYAAQALNPARNKLERLISTREIDTLLRHPVTLDLEGIIERGEVLIVAGAKAAVGEDNTILVTQLLLQLLHRAVQAQQDLPDERHRRVSLLIDEAHNVLTPSVAKMLAEGRSAGLEAVFAWQYSAQIRDEVIRSGARSLLQSISIFRMREMEDARSLAGLAMEVYSDRIGIDQEEQERLRFSADDIVKLPIHRAINLWVADGTPRAGFLAHTLPMEDLQDDDAAEQQLQAQRDRGAHHPAALGDPLAALDLTEDAPAGVPPDADAQSMPAGSSNPKSSRAENAQPRPKVSAGDSDEQLRMPVDPREEHDQTDEPGA